MFSRWTLLGSAALVLALCAGLWVRGNLRSTHVAALVAAPAGVAPVRFDLFCRGKDLYANRRNRAQAFEVRVSIDLEHGLYCDGECRKIPRINRANSRVIVLSENFGRHHEISGVTRSDRNAITFRDYFGSNWDRQAICTPTTFSGFPWFWRKIPWKDGMAVQGNWRRSPTEAALDDAYPRLARILGLGGHAQVRCRAGVQGTLTDCRLVRSEPQHLGFGVAALKLAREYALEPISWTGRPVQGETIDLSIEFGSRRSSSRQ